MPTHVEVFSDEIVVNDSWFILCPSRTERYVQELKKLEKRLEGSNHSEFWSIESYLIHCKENGTSDNNICDEFRTQGFKNFADKYGLAWIRQIYIPRIRELSKEGLLE